MSNEALLNSPLYIATRVNDLELFKLHIENGANPFHKNEYNNNLLHFAAIEGKLIILKYLVGELGCSLAEKSFLGRTPLHAAAAANQLQVVKYFIEDCQLDPSALDERKRTPLSRACDEGHLEMAHYLVQSMLKNMSMEDILDSYDLPSGDDRVNGPLCCACLGGHLPLVKYLVEERGCDPSQPEGVDKHKTPLWSAVMGNQLHIADYLLLKKVEDSKSDYLVCLAMEMDHNKMANLLTGASSFSDLQVRTC